jgi:hypothetical protein
MLRINAEQLWHNLIRQGWRRVRVDVEPGQDWPAIADQFNRYLGPMCPGAPFSAEQTATIEMCLSLAREAVTDELSILVQERIC